MDDCPTQHSYNTRSKRKKRAQKQTKGKKALGKSDVKSIRNSKSKIKMDVSNHSSIIEELVTHKPVFKDSDSDYNPEDDEYLRYLDALEDEDNLQIHLKLCKDDDVDEHGNIKGLINYDYDSDDKGTSSEELKNVGILYSFLTKSLISAIEGIDEKSDDDEAVVSTRKDTTTKDRYTKRNLYKRYTPIERNYYENISVEERDRIFELEREIAKESDDVPLRFKILNTSFPLKTKKKLLDKVNVLNHIDKGNSEYYKLKRWVDGLMRIPFGKYIDPPVSKKDTPDDISKYIIQAYDTLDKAVYGHEDAKTEIMLAISKWISNPSSHGNVIGIQGPPGNGKTTLVRKGISKAINRPFAFITLGGATDASFLEGHSYTYEGSIPGRIVEILGDSDIGCMNPIFYFDELDKVSDTAKGHEIHNILCHLTDFSQNDAFHDKYYSGIDFDLSKALFIFSFNDIELVNPILRDRMTIIKTAGFNKNQKVELATQFLLPEIYKEIGMSPEMLQFNETILGYIVSNHTGDEAGVRSLKRKLTRIISKLNINILLGSKSKIPERILPNSYNFPLRLTNTIVDQLLKSNEETDRATRIEMSMYM